MNQLITIQHQFWKYLREKSYELSSASQIIGNDTLSSNDRINIYRSTIRTAHINALSDTFNCCEKILGKRYFNQLANAYFDEHPAKSQNLNAYGSSFPEFCQTWIYNHDELDEYTYLSDLAKLEYIFEQTYFCKDDPKFNFESFSVLTEKQQHNVIFQLSYTLNFLVSTYPIFEIWNINQSHFSQQEVKSIIGKQYLCVFRENFKPHLYKIDWEIWWVLIHLRQGYSLESLQIKNEREGINVSIDKIIPRLIQLKWISNYALNSHV